MLKQNYDQVSAACFPLNDLFALPDLAYISGSFDPAEVDWPTRSRMSWISLVAGWRQKKMTWRKGREKRLSLAESANFKLMVSTQIQPG